MSKHALAVAAAVWLVPAAAAQIGFEQTGFEQVGAERVGSERVRLALRGVHFVPNRGQWSDRSVVYGFRSRGMDIAFGESSLTMHLRREKEIHHGEHAEDALLAPSLFGRGQGEGLLAPSPLGRGQGEGLHSIDYGSLVLEVTFPGSNMVQPIGAMPQAARFNYYVGDDESKWASDVPSFAAIVYEDLYDGVDLHVLSSDAGVLKYEFHCDPGADYSRIRIRYDGIDALRINEGTGDLLIETSFGALRDGAPLVWQGDTPGSGNVPGVEGVFPPLPFGEGRGEGIPTIPARFETLDQHTYTIALDAAPDPSLPLVIDPEIEWMYYLGGSREESGHGIAVDSAGNALVAGATRSADFAGRTNSHHGTFDAFALKVSPSGQLQWMTYLGGSGDDWGLGIAVDRAGNALVTGDTDSIDFGGRNNSYYGRWSDAFALKVTSSGQLQWMTYLGGSHDDLGAGIAVDRAGNALVVGRTKSTDFAGRNNSHHGTFDAFALKVTPSGQLQWMTYLGGSGDDLGHGIAVDSVGNALVAGTTVSSNFAGRNNLYYGRIDAFALKLRPSGRLQWMTYLGGSAWDWGSGIAVDSAGNPLVAGFTYSADFAGANNPHHGGIRDAYTLKVSPSGQLQWMTYLGGSGHDWAWGIAVDSAGNALVTGNTGSTDFAGRNNSYHGGDRDASALKVGPSGQLQWMTYLGGSVWDDCRGIAVDSAGNALVTGFTWSGDFAGRNNAYHGISDAFIVKLSIDNCYADCDRSGVLDVFDFLCFQNSFVAGEPYACECDPDPACDIFDFLCFQTAFVAGCP